MDASLANPRKLIAELYKDNDDIRSDNEKLIIANERLKEFLIASRNENASIKEENASLQQENEYLKREVTALKKGMLNLEREKEEATRSSPIIRVLEEIPEHKLVDVLKLFERALNLARKESLEKQIKSINEEIRSIEDQCK